MKCVTLRIPQHIIDAILAQRDCRLKTLNTVMNEWIVEMVSKSQIELPLPPPSEHRSYITETQRNEFKSHFAGCRTLQDVAVKLGVTREAIRSKIARYDLGNAWNENLKSFLAEWQLLPTSRGILVAFMLDEPNRKFYAAAEFARYFATQMVKRLKSNNHRCVELQLLFNKYGIDRLRFEHTPSDVEDLKKEEYRLCEADPLHLNNHLSVEEKKIIQCQKYKKYRKTARYKRWFDSTKEKRQKYMRDYTHKKSLRSSRGKRRKNKEIEMLKALSMEAQNGQATGS
jgi:hypothetical protein